MSSQAGGGSPRDKPWNQPAWRSVTWTREMMSWPARQPPAAREAPRRKSAQKDGSSFCMEMIRLNPWLSAPDLQKNKGRLAATQPPTNEWKPRRQQTGMTIWKRISRSETNDVNMFVYFWWSRGWTFPEFLCSLMSFFSICVMLTLALISAAPGSHWLLENNPDEDQKPGEFNGGVGALSSFFKSIFLNQSLLLHVDDSIWSKSSSDTIMFYKKDKGKLWKAAKR